MLVGASQWLVMIGLSALHDWELKLFFDLCHPLLFFKKEKRKKRKEKKSKQRRKKKHANKMFDKGSSI